MESCESGTVRDEELFAYLAGERVRPLVVHHLANCAACQARLNEYKRMELTLTSRLYRWDCPSSQVLGEFELGLLSPRLNQAIEAHVAMCVQCAAEIALLSNFMADELVPAEARAISPLSASPVPTDSQKKSVGKPALKRLQGQAQAGFRRIVATLVPPQPRLAFQRDVVQRSTWPRRYVAEDLTIALQLEPEIGTGAGQDSQLIGFVTRDGATLETLQGTPVMLSSQGSVLETQQIDELGNFIFASVPSAAYNLELRFPERTIVLENLQG